jgi:hypothetical protein
MKRSFVFLACALLGTACPLEAPQPDAAVTDASPDVAPPTSLMPADYRQRFVEVRDCRNSIDHDLNHILIRTDRDTAPLYRTGPFPLPVGTLVVKEEYGDAICAELTGYTLMRKEAPGYDPRFGDWHWQRLDARGRVLADGKGEGATLRCASCHASAACRTRDFTCAEP